MLARHSGPKARARDWLDDVAELLKDPVSFSRGLLCHDPWPIQEQILMSVATRPRTAVKACHSSGKTFTAADIMLWWPIFHERGIAISTAPTWTQVEKLLWGHMHTAARTGVVRFPKMHKAELPLAADNYAIGLSTNEGVRFQGWHGDILIVLDEAPGVLTEIYEAIEGIRAGGNVHVLLLGQPAMIGGPFYDAFHAQRQSWECLTISAFDTPNLAGVCLDAGDGTRFGSEDLDAPNLLMMSEDELDANPRPYLTTRRWVREKWQEWGEAQSPLWDVKVLGQFPAQSEDALIPLAWLERAARLIPGHEHEPLRAGVDVAGPGEAETVVSIRQGPNRIALKPFTHADARGPVVDYLRPFKDRLEQVNYDEIGTGHYFGMALKDAGFPVRGVNVQETEAVDKERFKNQKAEYFWALRERAQRGDLGGITDAKEQAQLLTIRYQHNARGQVEIVGKPEMAKQGIPSPDRAEADMLAFAPDVPVTPPVPRRWGVGSASYSG